ncbi:MAG: 4Fe-4S dicluster domain-containing protein, partial [Nitrososphaerales archaeon]
GGLGASSIWVRSAGGVRKGFVVIVCRACTDPPCARVCPTDALPLRPGGGVRLKPELCIGCHNCADACPYGAVLWDGEQNKPEICVHRAYCVAYCPYDVLSMEELPASEGLASGSATAAAAAAAEAGPRGGPDAPR